MQTHQVEFRERLPAETACPVVDHSRTSEHSSWRQFYRHPNVMVTSKPRICFGAISVAYIGSTADSAPIGKPMSTRPTSSVVKLHRRTTRRISSNCGINNNHTRAQTLSCTDLPATQQMSVPSTKTADTIEIVLRRPSISDSWPALRAPVMAPKLNKLTNKPLSRSQPLGSRFASGAKQSHAQ